jgi:hypothetical protein
MCGKFWRPIGIAKRITVVIEDLTDLDRANAVCDGDDDVGVPVLRHCECMCGPKKPLLSCIRIGMYLCPVKILVWYIYESVLDVRGCRHSLSHAGGQCYSNGEGGPATRVSCRRSVCVHPFGSHAPGLDYSPRARSSPDCEKTL